MKDEPPIMGFCDPYEDTPTQAFITVEDCARECRCRAWFLIGVGLIAGVIVTAIVHRIIT
ncbi:hypothetical protein [Azospirillum sp.]|uniref:hypothetical protein n=1 Tax=Azospirillum sp. TaxID=34012 RepID=UPI003D765E8F